MVKEESFWKIQLCCLSSKQPASELCAHPLSLELLACLLQSALGLAPQVSPVPHTQ